MFVVVKARDYQAENGKRESGTKTRVGLAACGGPGKSGKNRKSPKRVGGPDLESFCMAKKDPAAVRLGPQEGRQGDGQEAYGRRAQGIGPQSSPSSLGKSARMLIKVNLSSLSNRARTHRREPELAQSWPENRAVLIGAMQTKPL